MGPSDAVLEAVEAASDERIAAAVERAASSPAPAVAELASGMHAVGSAEQFERMLPGAPFGERELVFAGGLGE